MSFDVHKIDKSWTLFLDRDGVINYERKGEYVTHWGEFIFHEMVPESLFFLNSLFGKVFIVTNQRGVSKGLMTESDLLAIHSNMLKAFKKAGGHIDKIYYCLAMDPADPFRKPNPGMALQAKKEYPDVDFSRSVMVGNKISDMEFGRNAGMYTIFLSTTNPEITLPDPSIDYSFPNLPAFAAALK